MLQRQIITAEVQLCSIVRDTYDRKMIKDLVKSDDRFRVITYDCETWSVAKEQLGKEPQKHCTDFFILNNNTTQYSTITTSSDTGFVPANLWKQAVLWGYGGTTWWPSWLRDDNSEEQITVHTQSYCRHCITGGTSKPTCYFLYCTHFSMAAMT